MAFSGPPSQTRPSLMQDDPLLHIIMPPRHETAQQRAARETSEMQAKALSEEIDRQLYRDRDTLTNKDTNRILLLGQSESGKSTTLKNFQLFYSPQAFSAERKAWRYVILLNLARSVRIILELMEAHFALQDEYEASLSSITYTSLVATTRSNWHSLSKDMTAATGKPSPSFNQPSPPMTGHRTLPCCPTSSFANSELSSEHGPESTHRAFSVRSTHSTHRNGDMEGEARKNKKDTAKKRFTMNVLDEFFHGNIWKKRTRSCSATATLPNPIRNGKDRQNSSTTSTCSTLSSGKGYRGISRSSIVAPAPCHQIRSQLADIFKPPAGPLLTPHHRLLKMKLAPLAAIESQLLYELSTPAEDELETRCPCSLGQLGDIWDRYDHKELIVRPLGSWEEKFGRLRIGTPKWLREEPKVKDPDDPSHVISACATDVNRLWKDPAVRELLAQNEIHLECEPGFFLNDLDRVAKLDYQPTDDDILRARLRTNGVCEYKFMFGKAKRGIRHWVIYDVGGTRAQRAVWQSYFDDVDAIIFLAPLSAFDQNLVEDPMMNRMEDSVRLFRSVCRSRLLTRVNLILLLNKADLLEAKLKAGVQVNKFIKHYGNRGNTPEAVTEYFRHLFAAIHKKATPIETERIFYSHVTSVTNPHFMRSIMEILRDVIIRDNVEDLVL